MPDNENASIGKLSTLQSGISDSGSTISFEYVIDSALGIVIRNITLDNGNIRTSNIPINDDLQSTSDPLNLHDTSWLRLKHKPSIPSPRSTVQICDLFSGCGGITAGVEEACRALEIEMKPVLAWDILEGAKRTYEKNFSPVFFRDDDIEQTIDGEIGDPITDSEAALLAQIASIDIVVGGPPCQGHSDLNNHSRRDDVRNELYMRMTRFIEITKPKIAIIENVLTVQRAKSRVVQRTIDFLRELGYGVEQHTIRGIDLGLPQDRRRHFTIATLGKTPAIHSIIGKRVEIPRNVMWAIDDLRGFKGESTFETSATHQIQNRERIAWMFGKDWEEWEIEKFNVSGDPNKPEAYNLPNHRRPKCHQNGHNYPAVYGRMYPNLPSPTITTGFGSTGQGRFVHPFEQRSLTPHEAARVQGFPDFFDFSTETGRGSLQTLIGNAVPPLMAEHLLVHLLAMFDGEV